MVCRQDWDGVSEGLTMAYLLLTCSTARDVHVAHIHNIYMYIQYIKFTYVVI